MSNQGWGHGEWGESPWGTAGPPVGGTIPPRIIAVDPIEEATGVPRKKRVCIRITDDGDDGTRVLLSSLRIAIGGTNYIFGGVAQPGADVTVTDNGLNGFDVDIGIDSPYEAGKRYEVVVNATDTVGNASEKVYFFTAGVGPRILKVSNPSEGVLLVHFNRAMEHNATFLDPATWVVSGVSEGAPPMTITAVTADSNKPEVAMLRHVGGGSTYEMCALGGVSQAGESIERGYSKAIFELLYAQEEDATVRLFDTVFGPIGISQRLRLRRTMDGHVANRSIALAMDEQFRLRMQGLDGTIGRDGRPGKNRT